MADPALHCLIKVKNREEDTDLKWNNGIHSQLLVESKTARKKNIKD